MTPARSNEISIVFFQRPSTRFSRATLFSRFLLPPLAFAQCPSSGFPPSSCVSRTLYPCRNSLTSPLHARTKRRRLVHTTVPYSQCARGFHIKGGYLLMRRNYPAHNGRRRRAAAESSVGVSGVSDGQGWTPRRDVCGRSDCRRDTDGFGVRFRATKSKS